MSEWSPFASEARARRRLARMAKCSCPACRRARRDGRTVLLRRFVVFVRKNFATFAVAFMLAAGVAFLAPARATAASSICTRTINVWFGTHHSRVTLPCAVVVGH